MDFPLPESPSSWEVNSRTGSWLQLEMPLEVGQGPMQDLVSAMWLEQGSLGGFWADAEHSSPAFGWVVCLLECWLGFGFAHAPGHAGAAQAQSLGWQSLVQ